MADQRKLDGENGTSESDSKMSTSTGAENCQVKAYRCHDNCIPNESHDDVSASVSEDKNLGKSVGDEGADLEKLLDIIKERTTKMRLREKHLNVELASKDAEINRLERELALQKDSDTAANPSPSTQ